MSYFLDTAANIEGNKKLRTPQIEAYIKIKNYFSKERENRQALVVLPTGTGKSGLVSIAPYGVSNKRVLIITPGLVTKDSIRKTQEVMEDNFWINQDVIFSAKDIPIVTEYHPDVRFDYLEKSHIVYTNIHRVSGRGGALLKDIVPPDFFDFIIIDEAHHAPANSWIKVISYFNSAKILHVTGTPYRGDGKKIPGVKIHETRLSEVMRDKYVKWLRKETVNSHELFFTIPEKPGEKLSKEEVLLFKDDEWIEKSVALSEDCSKDVIDCSIKELEKLKNLPKKVPHKILAIGCSISHAEDLLIWYKGKGLNSVIVHSNMSSNDIEDSFKKIEQNECDVVISVNMLMEGYDHKYLSILAIFRPYKSINAFSQIVGRILRAIPEEEINDFGLDNNGLIIYHSEIGLDEMWHAFHEEVEIASRLNKREYNFTDREYVEREAVLANIDSGDAFVEGSDSYLSDIDFNAIFEQKRNEISASVDEKIEQMRGAGIELSGDVIEALRNTLVEQESQKAANDDIDPLIVERRPAQAQSMLKKRLTQKTREAVANLLFEEGIDEKSSSLYENFERYIYPRIETDEKNDAIIMRFINGKLYKQFGKVTKRDNEQLILSLEKVDILIEEARRMLK